MMKTHIRKTPQEIRAAAEKLIARHDANFDRWLEIRQAAIGTRNSKPSQQQQKIRATKKDS
jgi:hypothetical protein